MNVFYEQFASYCSRPISQIIANLSQGTDKNVSALVCHFFVILFCISLIFLIYNCLVQNIITKKTTTTSTIISLLSVVISIFYFWFSAASQNSVSPYIFPSYHRETLLSRTNSKDKVPEEFVLWRTEHAVQEFIRNFDWNEYQRLNYDQILDDSQSQLIKLGKSLGYNEGHQTIKIKTLEGVPRLLGYSYGGPAYYDSFTHEVVIPDSNDYPASRYFFISTIVHELSHALFFQKELDATLLQYKAMLNSKYSTVRALANFLWLEYSPFVQNPQFYKYLVDSGIDHRFVAEILSSRTMVRKRLKNLRAIETLKDLMHKIKLQNQASKYGWEPDKYATSPFYKVIFTWELDLWKINPTFRKKFTDKFNWSNQ